MAVKLTQYETIYMKEDPHSHSSFEDRFYLENPSLFARFRRNASLLFALLLAAAAWLFKGARLRRAIRQAKQNKQPLNLEDWTD